MNQPAQDLDRLKQYREIAAKLHDLSAGIEERIAQAARSGQIKVAHDALEELQLKTKELDDFRATLSPEEIFLAKYGVEVIDEHTVSFVIPRGVSRLEILKEAHVLHPNGNLIKAWQLEKFEDDPSFTTEAAQSERICISGHVPNSENKTREQQENMVGKNNLATCEDLTVAFAVNWIATAGILGGQALFGWCDSWDRVYQVRAGDVRLCFEHRRHNVAYGLHTIPDEDGRSAGSVACGARVAQSGDDLIGSSEEKIR